MAAQLFGKLDRHAVNILFSDQWATYGPLFDDYNAWQAFTMQFGPPRLGLGEFVAEAVAHLTAWDARRSLRRRLHLSLDSGECRLPEVAST
jgi:hypothetical protein